MTDPTRPDQPDARQRMPEAAPERRWLTPLLLTVLVLVPIGILIFSNLDATEVSWAGFRFNQPLWVLLLVTFVAGMVGGKIAGWGWRHWRKRRKRLKEELQVLRKHAADNDPAGP
jgi:uncharacterized integral membrane protein